MNHNEEVPDFLGGLGDMLPADALKKLNELLEHLHRKDKDHQGSIVINYYAEGSWYVDNSTIGTLNNNGGCSHSFGNHFPATRNTAKTLYLSLNSYERI